MSRLKTEEAYRGSLGGTRSHVRRTAWTASPQLPVLRVRQGRRDRRHGADRSDGVGGERPARPQPHGVPEGRAWHLLLNGKERGVAPAEARGRARRGKWEAGELDQALTEIADHLLDAIEEIGPQSIIHEGTPAEGGLLAMMPFGRLTSLLGATRTDVNAVINDNSPGTYLTYGKFDPVLSMDDMLPRGAGDLRVRQPALHHDPRRAHRHRGPVIAARRSCSWRRTAARRTCMPTTSCRCGPGTDAAFALGMAQ